MISFILSSAVTEEKSIDTCDYNQRCMNIHQASHKEELALFKSCQQGNWEAAKKLLASYHFSYGVDRYQEVRIATVE